MERWILEAKEAIAIDAEVAYQMICNTAEKERVDVDWAIETFVQEFKRICKKRE